MSRDIVKVSPAAIQWRFSADFGRNDIDHEAMRTADRQLLSDTAKHQSIVQRYAEGRRWEDTPLFQDIYQRRLQSQAVRGCHSMAELLEQYYTRVDALFADMQRHGYRDIVDGTEVPPIWVYVAHDGAIVLGNQGNHRIAMAQVLKLDHVVVDVVARHPDSERTDLLAHTIEGPELPASARSIPAMTTEAERRCYYRLTKQMASQGAIVELGAWMGASTAYLAAGIRDSGVEGQVHVYDQFISKPAHIKKVKAFYRDHGIDAVPVGPSLEAFKANLGPLLDYVIPYPGRIEQMKWGADPIALLVADAPKRIQEISAVLTNLRQALGAGAVMAWQDFAYFPSYDIPAALIRLNDHVEFAEAVYPGTTVVFRVRRPWTNEEVSPAALSLKRWSPDEVESAWRTWTSRLPEPMRPRFACGAAMFLCDLGAFERAQRCLSQIVDAHADAVLPKWRYLIEERSSLMARYQPLMEVITSCA